MITIKVQGGLGNQLFQYAFGRSVSARKKMGLSLETSFYEKSLNRRFELSEFNIKALVRRNTIFDKIFGYSKKAPVIKDQGAFDSRAFNASENTVFDGYWQSEKYFPGLEKELRQEITLRKPLGSSALAWEKKIRGENSISIHIRRGDYLTQKHVHIHGVLPVSYYQKAAKFFVEKEINPVFFVFSDDIAWAKENLKLPYRTEFVSGEEISVPEELILMSTCKHHIIANSSFSWWGAWLSPNSDKVVIAPQKWFADPTKDAADIIPETWIKM